MDLLELIIRGFNEDTHVMAEAGTGVGKSFAYLLPAMHYALLNKTKVIISTATITLQQQLYEKDIPLVSSAIGKEVKTVVMKGRGNYLCLRRLEEVMREPPLDDFNYEELKNIFEWSKNTMSGGKSELTFMPDDSIWSSVCSESDLCLGLHCHVRENCFIQKLRREANNASIIVANHHLLFADLAARYQGAGYENSVVLPPFNRLIIDEAHTIEKAATSFFSAEFGRTGIIRQLGRLYHRRRQNIRGLLVRLCAMLPSSEDPLDNIADTVQKVRKAAENLDECALELCDREGIYRLSPSSDFDFLKKSLFPQLKTLRKNLLTLTNLIRDVTESLEEEAANEPPVWETKSIMRRLENTAEICDVFCKYQKHEDEVLWMRKNSYSGNSWTVFIRTPLDLAPKLKESVFTPNKTVACVSATLAVNNDFSYWASRSGIGQSCLSGCFPSPFPYTSAVLLVSPTDAPAPDEEGWQEYINEAVGRIVSVTDGSALVLFTSYQTLGSVYNHVKSTLTSLGIRCLKQGDDDRTRLLQDFLSDTRSCLFATDSFWEGVDAPGDTLRLVIICRLPFRTPGDPVFEARREAVEKNGRNPFMELSLPQAVMKFKQGFGRLMRKSADHGIVAILDSRILKKSYGKLFIHSLPETRTSFCELDSILQDIERFLY